MHVVFGAYDGQIDAKPGEKVVFIGDCAELEGRASTASRSRSRASTRIARTMDPHTRETEDIFVKLAKAGSEARAAT